MSVVCALTDWQVALFRLALAKLTMERAEGMMNESGVVDRWCEDCTPVVVKVLKDYRRETE